MKYEAISLPHVSYRVIADWSQWDEDMEPIKAETTDKNLIESGAIVLRSPFTDEKFYFMGREHNNYITVGSAGVVAFFVDDKMYVLEWIPDTPGFRIYE